MTQPYYPPPPTGYAPPSLPEAGWQHGTEAVAGTRGRPLWVDLSILAAVAVVMGVAGFFVGRGSAGDDDAGGTLGGPSALQAAYDDCTAVDSDNTMSLADGGQSIIIDTGSKYGDPSGMDCVLRELDTPQSVQAQIGSTTAMMGVQDADHDGLHYSWSYHPDNGVNMVIESTR